MEFSNVKDKFYFGKVFCFACNGIKLKAGDRGLTETRRHDEEVLSRLTPARGAEGIRDDEKLNAISVLLDAKPVEIRKVGRMVERL